PVSPEFISDCTAAGSARQIGAATKSTRKSQPTVRPANVRSARTNCHCGLGVSIRFPFPFVKDRFQLGDSLEVFRAPGSSFYMNKPFDVQAVAAEAENIENYRVPLQVLKASPTRDFSEQVNIAHGG